MFLDILILITILPVLVKFLTIPRLMAVLTPKATNVAKTVPIPENGEIRRIVKYTDYILTQNFWIYKTTCLKRSLVLYHFLWKLGMEINVCFGLKMDNGRIKNDLEGHAWLVYRGNTFLEKNPELTKRYKPTYCFPEIKERTT